MISCSCIQKHNQINTCNDSNTVSSDRANRVARGWAKSVVDGSCQQLELVLVNDNSSDVGTTLDLATHRVFLSNM